MSFMESYAHYLKGYADARLGRYPVTRGRKLIDVAVTWNADGLTVSGTTSAGLELKAGEVHIPEPIELAPIHITEKQVQDDWAPRILDERLPLWRTAIEQPVRTP